jgi:hypothetical protein
LTRVGSRRSASSASAFSSSLDSTYARRKPGSVIVLPVAAKSTSSLEVETARMRTLTELPTASVICEAIVRRQISS